MTKGIFETVQVLRVDKKMFYGDYTSTIEVMTDGLQWTFKSDKVPFNGAFESQEDLLDYVNDHAAYCKMTITDITPKKA